MARRTFALGLAEDRIGGHQGYIDADGDMWEPVQSEYEAIDPAEYVSVAIDGTAFERLLWREIKRTIKRAHLTDWQQVVFVDWLKGESQAKIAVHYARSESTISKHFKAAYLKVVRVPFRGLLTSSIETFRWEDVRDAYSR